MKKSPETRPPAQDINWKEELLSLDINHAHKSRTCDIFLMSEKESTYSKAIELFNAGGKLDPTNCVKSINYSDILANIEKFSLDTSSKVTGDVLYQLAAKEVKNYLNNKEEIPLGLLVQLIKLQIISVINHDVALIQKKVICDTELEREGVALMGGNDGDKKEKGKKGKKGKGKTDTKEKAKGKKGAKDKGKSSVKLYDVCNPNNEVQIKNTSRLDKNVNELTLKENVEIEEKHLFLIIVAIYELNVIQELHKIGVVITGILELTNSNHPNNFVLEKKNNKYTKFWENIYGYLESDDNCPDYLENTYHMTVSLVDPCCGDVSNQKQCSKVFYEIGKEVMKSLDVKYHHINYIRHLKMYPTDSEPSRLPIRNFHRYNNIMGVIPPDCCNISTIMYGLIGEVSSRVPDPIQTTLDTPSSTVLDSDQSVSDKNNLPNAHSKIYLGVKGQIAEILKTAHLHSFNSNKYEKEYSYDPKIDQKLYFKNFLTHDNDNLEIMMNSYNKLKSQLLDINIARMIKSIPVMLWKVFPCITTELRTFFELHAIADTLDLPIQELQFAIHKMLLNSLTCDNNPLEKFCSFQTIFPKIRNASPLIASASLQKSISCTKNIAKTENPEYENLYENLYEAKHLSTYEWYETLPMSITLQELSKVDRDYLCLDYKCCAFDDSILLRYHNNVDEFGINTTTWDQSLRTPIFSIREFCRYVMHTEGEWIEKQEQRLNAELEREFQATLNEAYKEKKNFYPDLMFNDRDFTQSCSLKGKMLKELEKPPQTNDLSKKESKSSKSKKEKKSASSKIGKSSKLSSKGQPAPQLALLEKLSKSPPYPSLPKLNFSTAGEKEPFTFYAYDISNNVIELTGSTIVFHSQDGYKVTVDQTRFIKQPKVISFNMSINSHNLILRHNQSTFDEPFTFHFALEDNSIIAFTKPSIETTPEEKLVQRINDSVQKAETKRQDIYFISEKQHSILKCFNIPYVTRKNVILSEDLMVPFLNQLSKQGIKPKLMSHENLNPNELEIFKKALQKSGSKTSHVKKEVSIDRIAEPKYNAEIISKLSRILTSETISDDLETFTKSRKSLSDIFDLTVPLKKSNRKLLNKIREAFEAKVPIFRICSSALHKCQYVKRVKSRIEIEVGTALKRVLCTSSMYRSKHLDINKLLPIKPCTVQSNNNSYEIRICLPSGLLIQSIQGEPGEINIRQKYLDKGPQCKNISYEYSRTFMRNGSVLIKKCDGSFAIFNITGEIVNCSVSYFKVKPKMKIKRCQNNKENDLILLHTRSLTKFQKRLYRLQKHKIVHTHRLTSHKACQRWKKNYITNPNQVYMLQTSVGDLKQYRLISSDGKQLKVTPTIISEEKKYFTSTTLDYRYEEIYYGREDGTHSLLNRDSMLVTQFPDGTRLSTWIEIESNSIMFEEDHPSKINILDKTQQAFDESESKKTEDGWISIHLNMKYEHPNYATIIYYGQTKLLEILLPNNVTIKGTPQGDYMMVINNNINVDVTKAEIVLNSRLCETCGQTTTSKFNIHPICTKNVNTKEILFYTKDTFNKVFTVDYSGKCFRNLNYHKEGINSVGCKHHTPFDSQKLFVLFRNLASCKFWNINEYKHRITEANLIGSCIKRDKYSSEIKTCFTKPYHEKFLIPYEQSSLVLTKYRSMKLPPKHLAYVTIQIINLLPTNEKLHEIYLILSKLIKTRQVSISETFEKEMIEFLSNINNKKANSVSSIEIIPTPPLVKKDIIPFEVKHKYLLEKRNYFWKEIRENALPQYFYSKQYRQVTGENIDKTLQLCKCDNLKPKTDTCECLKINNSHLSQNAIKTVEDIQEIPSNTKIDKKNLNISSRANAKEEKIDIIKTEKINLNSNELNKFEEQSHIDGCAFQCPIRDNSPGHADKATQIEEANLHKQKDTSPYFGIYAHYCSDEIIRPKSLDTSAGIDQIDAEVSADDTPQSSIIDILDSKNMYLEVISTADIKVMAACRSSDHEFSRYHNEKCDKCIAYVPPPETLSKQSQVLHSEVAFSPSVDKHQPSNTTNECPNKSVTYFKDHSSGTVRPHIELGTDANLLDHSLSDTLMPVKDNAVVLKKVDYHNTESKIITFSIASLKDKRSITVLPPFSERNPAEAFNFLDTRIQGSKKSRTDQYQNINTLTPEEPISSNYSLIPEENFYKCEKCILRLEDEMISPSPSEMTITSLASLTSDYKRAQDGVNLTFKNNIDAKVPSRHIKTANVTKVCKLKYKTPELVSLICDDDAKGDSMDITAKQDSSQKLCKKVFRKTIGSQTQGGMVDECDQTLS